MSHGEINKRLRLGSLEETRRGCGGPAPSSSNFSAMYGGYFGAGNGILMLAAMGLLGLNDLHRANGIKNFLGICINCIAVSVSHWLAWWFWQDALADGLRRSREDILARKWRCALARSGCAEA